MAGQRLGSFGIAGSFSFQASKTLTAGEGGAIVTSDKALFERCSSLRDCGRLQGRPVYEHYHLGSNYRMTPMQAALLKVQLERLIKQVLKRIENARSLDTSLATIPGIVPQYRDPQDTAPGYLYVFYYQPDEFAGLSRQEFVQALQAEGILCQEAGYPAIHKTALFKDRGWGKKEALFNSERAASETVWLPHRLLLSEPQQLTAVAEAIKKLQLYSTKLQHRQ